MGDLTITTVTLQAALFSLLSTALAQCISAWRGQNTDFTVSPFFTFAAMALILTPPNHLFQTWLENTFPTNVASSSSNSKQRYRLSKRNTVVKFLLDQALSASANTAAFIALIQLSKGHGLQSIISTIEDEFLPMLFAGWRFWPLVTATNLCVVPWKWRPAVGNTAGLCWGVYLTVRNL